MEWHLCYAFHKDMFMRFILSCRDSSWFVVLFGTQRHRWGIVKGLATHVSSRWDEVPFDSFDKLLACISLNRQKMSKSFYGLVCQSSIEVSFITDLAHAFHSKVKRPTGTTTGVVININVPLEKLPMVIDKSHSEKQP